jgi:GntR family transcriptional regulator
VGTYVSVAPSDGPTATLRPLQRDLERWIARSIETGLDEEAIEALFVASLRGATKAAQP